MTGWSFFSGGLIYPQADSAFSAPPATNGSQIAFLQNSNASMWQTILLPTNSTGAYTLTYFVAGRPSGAASGNVIYNLTLDSNVILAGATTYSGEPFTLVTATFTAVPGNHVLAFTNSPNLPTDNTAFFDNVQITSDAQLIENGSFEFPAIGAGNGNNFLYSYSGFNGSDWTYLTEQPNSTNNTGIINQNGNPNNPPFNNVTNQPADGSQFAMLQEASAAISQTILLPTNGMYDLSYYVAGRPYGYSVRYGNSFGGNAINYVLLDSTVIATNLTIDAQPFTFKNVFFPASSGSHVLMFSNSAALYPNDETMLLDDVQLYLTKPVNAAAYAGLQIHGTPGTNYTVEFTGSLLPAAWETQTNIILTTNPFTYFDTTSAGIAGQRFYQCAGPAKASPAYLGIGIYTGYRIQGDSGQNYDLQYLDPARPAWTSIGKIQLPASPFLWLDARFSGPPTHAYYRAVVLP